MHQIQANLPLMHESMRLQITTTPYGAKLANIS